MTAECRIKYIQKLQCSMSDLTTFLISKYKIGKDCPDTLNKILVIQEYIESLYCYITPAPEGKTLDEINCLTEKEICQIVNHGLELIKDCNC